jgi:hypothetical protein
LSDHELDIHGRALFAQAGRQARRQRPQVADLYATVAGLLLDELSYRTGVLEGLARDEETGEQVFPTDPGGE